MTYSDTGSSKTETSKTERLLTGEPLPSLLLFSLPIICGNIFLQLYNIVDAIVVGRYLGSLSLAGISVAAPLMDVLYALILGGCIGISVLTGRAFGAGDRQQLRNLHTTALTGGAAVTILLSAAGFVFSRPILLAQGVSEETCAEALSYLNIILAGLIFSFLYNYLSSLLRSCGDSRSPFIVLLCSSTLHALLDVMLVGKMGLGIRGVACSTVFSQFVSSVWLFLIIYQNSDRPDTLETLRVPLSGLRPDPAVGLSILAFSWASALQQAVVCTGRLLIQGMLTGLGNEAVSGYNMGMRVEQFLFCFSQGISAALVVAISQNLGSGNYDRVKKFYYSSLVSGISLLAQLDRAFGYGPKGRGFESSNAQKSALPSRRFCFFRGLGKLKITMTASTIQIILRVLLSAFLVPRYQIRGICIAVISGWALLCLLEGGYSLRILRKEYADRRPGL